MNLYTVNAPWLFSLLWCAGVPSVTSDNSHTLSQVPSPLWIMVSRRGARGRGHLGVWELPVAPRKVQAPHLRLPGEVSGWGEPMEGAGLRHEEGVPAVGVCTKVPGDGGAGPDPRGGNI